MITAYKDLGPRVFPQAGGYLIVGRNGVRQVDRPAAMVGSKVADEVEHLRRLIADLEQAAAMVG